MANQIHAYMDRDIKRVVKAARSAGLDPTAVEVDTKTGKIKVFSSGGSEEARPRRPGKPRPRS